MSEKLNINYNNRELVPRPNGQVLYMEAPTEAGYFTKLPSEKSIEGRTFYELVVTSNGQALVYPSVDADTRALLYVTNSLEGLRTVMDIEGTDQTVPTDAFVYPGKAEFINGFWKITEKGALFWGNEATPDKIESYLSRKRRENFVETEPTLKPTPEPEPKEPTPTPEPTPEKPLPKLEELKNQIKQKENELNSFFDEKVNPLLSSFDTIRTEKMSDESLIGKVNFNDVEYEFNPAMGVNYEETKNKLKEFFRKTHDDDTELTKFTNKVTQAFQIVGEPNSLINGYIYDTIAIAREFAVKHIDLKELNSQKLKLEQSEADAYKEPEEVKETFQPLNLEQKINPGESIKQRISEILNLYKIDNLDNIEEFTKLSDEKKLAVLERLPDSLLRRVRISATKEFDDKTKTLQDQKGLTGIFRKIGHQMTRRKQISKAETKTINTIYESHADEIKGDIKVLSAQIGQMEFGINFDEGKTKFDFVDAKSIRLSANESTDSDFEFNPQETLLLNQFNSAVQEYVKISANRRYFDEKLNNKVWYDVFARRDKSRREKTIKKYTELKSQVLEVLKKKAKTEQINDSVAEAIAARELIKIETTAESMQAFVEDPKASEELAEIAKGRGWWSRTTSQVGEVVGGTSNKSDLETAVGWGLFGYGARSVVRGLANTSEFVLGSTLSIPILSAVIASERAGNRVKIEVAKEYGKMADENNVRSTEQYQKLTDQIDDLSTQIKNIFDRSDNKNIDYLIKNNSDFKKLVDQRTKLREERNRLTEEKVFTKDKKDGKEVGKEFISQKQELQFTPAEDLQKGLDVLCQKIEKILDTPTESLTDVQIVKLSELTEMLHRRTKFTRDKIDSGRVLYAKTALMQDGKIVRGTVDSGRYDLGKSLAGSLVALSMAQKMFGEIEQETINKAFANYDSRTTMSARGSKVITLKESKENILSNGYQVIIKDNEDYKKKNRDLKQFKGASINPNQKFSTLDEYAVARLKAMTDRQFDLDKARFEQRKRKAKVKAGVIAGLTSVLGMGIADGLSGNIKLDEFTDWLKNLSKQISEGELPDVPDTDIPGPGSDTMPNPETGTSELEVKFQGDDSLATISTEKYKNGITWVIKNQLDANPHLRNEVINQMKQIAGTDPEMQEIIRDFEGTTPGQNNQATARFYMLLGKKFGYINADGSVEVRVNQPGTMYQLQVLEQDGKSILAVKETSSTGAPGDRIGFADDGQLVNLRDGYHPGSEGDAFVGEVNLDNNEGIEGYEYKWQKGNQVSGGQLGGAQGEGVQSPVTQQKTLKIPGFNVGDHEGDIPEVFVYNRNPISIGYTEISNDTPELKVYKSINVPNPSQESLYARRLNNTKLLESVKQNIMSETSGRTGLEQLNSDPVVAIKKISDLIVKNASGIKNGNGIEALKSALEKEGLWDEYQYLNRPVNISDGEKSLEFTIPRSTIMEYLKTEPRLSNIANLANGDSSDKLMAEMLARQQFITEQQYLEKKWLDKLQMVYNPKILAGISINEQVADINTPTGQSKVSSVPETEKPTKTAVEKAETQVTAEKTAGKADPTESAPESGDSKKAEDPATPEEALENADDPKTKLKDFFKKITTPKDIISYDDFVANKGDYLPSKTDIAKSEFQENAVKLLNEQFEISRLSGADGLKEYLNPRALSQMSPSDKLEFNRVLTELHTLRVGQQRFTLDPEIVAGYAKSADGLSYSGDSKKIDTVEYLKHLIAMREKLAVVLEGKKLDRDLIQDLGLEPNDYNQNQQYQNNADQLSAHILDTMWTETTLGVGSSQMIPIDNNQINNQIRRTGQRAASDVIRDIIRSRRI